MRVCKEKWTTYNVDDTTGTHLALVDWNDTTIGYYVFGNSASDYSRCYVRSNDAPHVYLTNNNIMYHLQTQPEFWGDNPKEIIPEPGMLLLFDAEYYHSVNTNLSNYDRISIAFNIGKK